MMFNISGPPVAFCLCHGLKSSRGDGKVHKYSRGGASGGFRTRPIFTSSDTRPSFTVISVAQVASCPVSFQGGKKRLGTSLGTRLY